MSTSRRTFIRSAIAATMGAGAPACAVHGRPSGHTGTRIVSPTLAVVGPELEKGFAAQGRVRVLRQDGTDPRTGLVAPAALSEAGDAQTFFGPPSLVPLDAHMRLENLNPNVLLPGAFDAFTLAGAVYGLPLTYQAMWILHDKTIFARAVHGARLDLHQLVEGARQAVIGQILRTGSMSSRNSTPGGGALIELRHPVQGGSGRLGC